ncbi:MAG TPA: GNAT family N-acetyltransferase [Acidimicrobiales bacterium]|nr:GNAT family N-acetyltransferase [Acidimicrobiales bacterium]
MIIRPLEPDDAAACGAIIAGLPDFFGLESGIAACAEAVRSEPGYVAVDDGAVIGFLTVERPFAQCAEISWMAVERAHRGIGVGTALVDALVADEAAHGTRLLLVMTSGDAEEYVPTRAFYVARGFLPAKTFAGWWESDLPLLLVRPL